MIRIGAEISRQELEYGRPYFRFKRLGCLGWYLQEGEDGWMDGWMDATTMEFH